MLFYTAVSVAYGALTFLFLRLFIFIMLSLVHYFETWFLAKHGDGAYGHWQSMWPAPEMFRLPYDIDYSSLTPGQKIGAGILSFWIYLTISMLGAFAISFYFSANTIIYYLMRQRSGRDGNGRCVHRTVGRGNSPERRPPKHRRRLRRHIHAAAGNARAADG